MEKCYKCVTTCEHYKNCVYLRQERQFKFDAKDSGVDLASMHELLNVFGMGSKLKGTENAHNTKR
jgi:hypothetical protein